MQDAYAVEKSDAVGSWSEIGYTGPGSNYSGGAQSAIFTYSEIASDGTNAGWKASPTTSKLNECDSGEEWQLYAQFLTSNEGQGSVGYNATGESDCTDLTPAWSKLDDGRESS